MKKLTERQAMALNDMHEHRQRPDINWEDLRYFQRLAELHTLSAAARSLKVTHATIARRVKSLEETIGLPLFDQKPDGFELTPMGHTIFENVTAMGAQAVNIQDITEYKGPEGLVRLSATPALCEYIIAFGIQDFCKKYPKIEIEFLIGGRNVSLARHEAHIALRLARPETGEFVIKRVGMIDYQLYGSTLNSGKNQLKGPIVEFTSEFGDLPETEWLRKNLPCNEVAMKSNSLPCQRLAIERGIGIGLLPVYMSKESTTLQPLTEGGNKVLSREIWMVMRGTLVDVPRIRIVSDFITSLLKSSRPDFVIDC